MYVEILVIPYVTPQGLRKRLSTWIKKDKEFSQFIYLGKEKPPITLFEFFKIERGLDLNPIQVKKGLLLNKIGKLLKDEPELGRVLAMRKYVYVDRQMSEKWLRILVF